jgi:hypothetical protein
MTLDTIVAFDTIVDLMWPEEYLGISVYSKEYAFPNLLMAD